MTLDLRLKAYTPNGSSLGLLPAGDDVNLALPFDDLPAITTSYGVTAPRADILGQPLELAVEVSGDGGSTWSEPDDCRFLYLVDGRDPVKTADSYAVTAKGYVWRLSKARVFSNGLAEDGSRIFGGLTPGAILTTLLTEATTRGALAGMTFSSFNATTDSAGQAWGTTLSRSYELGKDYLSVLQDMAETGYVDFRMSGRELKVYRADTTLATDRTVGASQVQVTAQNATEAPFQRTWEGLASDILVSGDNASSVVVSNPSAVKPWGRWEDFISQGGVSDAGTLTAIGQQYQALTADQRTEYTVGLSFATGPRPLLDYTPGDFIWSRVVTGPPARYRVRQITLTRDANGVVAGNLVLNDRFVEADVRTRRQLDAISGSASAGGSSGGSPSAPGADILRPAQVTGLTGSSAAYLDGPTVRSQITLDWADVGANIDGTTLTDLESYQVESRPTGSGANWRRVTSTPATQSAATLSPYAPGDSWDFRVRAVDTSNNFGDWSTTVTVAASQDTTPPPAPSTPTLSSNVAGGVQVTWDGKTFTGTAMPADFVRVEVHMSSASGFTPNPGDSSTMVGTMGAAGVLNVTGRTVGGTAYVRLIARDTSLLASTPSAIASVVVGGGTDGAKPTLPGGWAPTLRTLGIGSLEASWAAVPNADPVTYRVYASATTPVVPSSTTFIGATSGTLLAITTLPTGPLLAGTDYYALVVPEDADGAVAAGGVQAGPRQVRQADTDTIASTWVYAGQVQAGQVASGTVTAALAVAAEIYTSQTGRRISLASDGLRAVDDQGNTIVSIPTDLSQDVSISADLVAASITADGMVALRNPTNELARNATLYLRSATTGPVTPPTVKITWPGWSPTGASSLLYGTLYAGAINAGAGYPGNYYWTSLSYGGSSGSRVVRVDKTNGAYYLQELTSNQGAAGWQFTCGVAKIGTTLYVLGFDRNRKTASGNYRLFLWGYDASATSYAPMNQISEVEVEASAADTAVSKANQPVLAYDGTNLYIARGTGADGISGNVQVKVLNRTTGATSSVVTTNAPVVGNINAPNLSGLCVGQFDFSAQRYVIATRGRTGGDLIYVTNTTGSRVLTDEWPPAEAAAIASFGWDPDQGFFVQYNTQAKVAQYTKLVWTTESSTWYATNTWEDTDTSSGSLPHESAQGVPAIFIMSKRAQLVVTSPTIPTNSDNTDLDDPDSANFYLGRGDGSRLTQWLQASPAPGVRTVTITAPVFSNADTLHPNPPLTSNFPAGTPARVASDNGIYYLDGNGDAKVRNLTYDKDMSDTGVVDVKANMATSTGGASGNNWAVSSITVARYQRVGSVYHFHLETSNSVARTAASLAASGTSNPNFANQYLGTIPSGPGRPLRQTNFQGFWNDAPITGAITAAGNIIINGGYPVDHAVGDPVVIDCVGLS